VKGAVARGTVNRLRAPLAAMLLLVSSTALADEPHARTLFREGEVAFATGHYAEAVKLFEAAYGESHKPAFLWNIASAHRAQFQVDGDVAHLRMASSVYHNYQSLVSDEGERAEAEKRIRALEEEIARVEAARKLAEPVKPAPPATAPTLVAPAPAPAEGHGLRFALLGGAAALVVAAAAIVLAVVLSAPSYPTATFGVVKEN
jgi:tetratricopeptide (TPR) repeat protein